MVPSSEEMNGTTGGTPNKTSGPTMTSPASINGTANQQPARQHVVDAEANGVGAVEAVYVRNASKSYGVGKRRAQVLRNLDMNVKKGTIYGLLGASGCGKTTLLSCIVGRRSFDSGEVLVFGGEPGSPQSGIPGPRVGYMPQELALYGEFTIKETLEYFGRIYRLPHQFVKSQMEFLFKLLDLPPGHRSVKTLSGGQQRRVSFAVALFHEPQLLILDEPTVGVDPLLRQSIWDHLVRLSTDHGKTIIITTHYIEEARQAHTIGLMRSGILLAEECPQTLLSLHGLSSLEDVFLKLCMKDRMPPNHRLAGKGVAPLVQTISDGKAQGAPDSAATADGGVDNPAFIQQEHLHSSSSSATTDDASSDGKDEDDDGEMAHNGNANNKALSQLSIVPMGCQYWKNNKSILPAVQEDGIVGLTFSPSGDHITRKEPSTERRMNEMNKQRQAGENGAGLHYANETKENLHYHSASSSSGGSSNSSNAGDTTSSCGSTSDRSSTRVVKRRSRTFALTVPSPHRTLALIRKNFMQTFRNIG